MCVATHPIQRSTFGARRQSDPSPLNDIHARLNESRPSLYRRPESLSDVFETLRQARRRGLSVAIAGGRHAMGGQQFLAGGCVLDMRGLNRILQFDRERGLITVEAGITWPELMRGYLSMQAGQQHQWGIRQKQTGADGLTVGGAIAANIHGRGLDCAPFAADLESLQVITPRGEYLTCSRQHQSDLFRLVVGGYGLFGVVIAATPAADPAAKGRACRVPVDPPRHHRRLRRGEWRAATPTATSNSPLTRGRRDSCRTAFFSCYRPVDNAVPIPANQLRLSQTDWRHLLYLAHVDKARAFQEFTRFYLRSSGQLYWNDTHQLNIYLDDYHRPLDEALGASVCGTEMITELYVPRARLAGLMADIREDFLEHNVNFIYGTVRLIKKDVDSFLTWAKEDYACVIFNLHVDHDAAGLRRARQDFRRLTDRAIAAGGSYFLTYHRHADREQVLRCYPEFPEFLRRKRAWDPEERFSSDWFRHYDALLGEMR